MRFACGDVVSMRDAISDGDDVEERERETENTQDSVESENGVHLGDPLNEIVVCECMCVMKASQIVVSHAMITIQKMNKSAVHRETHN